MEREREHLIPTDTMGDIYDGRVWKHFRSEFLSTPFSYLLTLNVDWFQPFKRCEYSVGAIYCVVQNLPRVERYKEDNVILVGLIPGPKEPSLSINSYLLPLIEELHDYYFNGLKLKSFHGGEITVRLALSCTSCDIPATRKLCGFLGHNARLGCNKCYKEFVNRETGTVNYSGYERVNWTARTASSHRSDCEEIQKEVTKTGIRNAESDLGVRYSTLLNLPYFDPIRFVAVDMMHNLFLGTGKHVFQLWIDLGLLKKKDVKQIDESIQKFVVPKNVGRLPASMQSNYSSFKAAQWSSWIMIYSPVALKEVLPKEHYIVWLLFVRACKILTQRILRISDVETGDELLLTFCKKIQSLYGDQHCTPNMHLHLHLKETLLDFGPAHATWCFSFERYNGILGSVPTNNRFVEAQFMHCFLRKQLLHQLSNKINDPDIHSLLPKPSISSTQLSSCGIDSCDDLLDLMQLSLPHFNPPQCSFREIGLGHLQLLTSSIKEKCFTPDEMILLKMFYEQLNPTCSVLYLSPFYVPHGRILYGDEVLGSTLNHKSANSSSFVSAFWPSGGSSLMNYDKACPSISQVDFYFRHSVTLLGSDQLTEVAYYTIAHVRWLESHRDHNYYGISAIVCTDSFKESSMCSFLPVRQIHSKCAYCRTTLNDEKVVIACPIPLKLSF